jgi:hypothetical protein
MDSLSRELVERLKSLGQEPARRSDTSAMAAQSVSMEDMLAAVPKSDDPAVRDYLAGVNSPFAGMMANLVTGDGRQARGLMGALQGMLGGKQAFGMMGGTMFSMGAKVEPTPAPLPASEERIAAAEAALGFALPAGLRQFYAEVADGGVGMGDGIFSLDELVAKHREMTRKPVGPQGQDWPANLLPIQGENWDLVSIDRDSGRLLFWDLEGLDDEDEDPDDLAWNASFRHEADSLEAWLAKWAEG